MDYKKDLAARLDQLRHIEGFPIGEDRDILALSDPPHFTACPNPYLVDFIQEHGTPYNEATDTYHREPFVSDVSEGKNDPIYNAHSYHTKVPHKAIMPFIRHYTEPGDLVLDAFCGTGMTGVATQLLGRKAILSDLSPLAAFIAFNYNSPTDPIEFEHEARRILAEVEEECGWMYETHHPALERMEDAKQAVLFGEYEDVKPNGKINFTIWSDVLICPFCQGEHVFWNEAITEEEEVLEEYPCPHCRAKLKKTECSRAIFTYFDKSIQQEVNQAKQVPVLINYSAMVKKKGIWKEKRFKKIPDNGDLNLIEKSEIHDIPYKIPSFRMPKGDESQRNDRFGITHAHHFYTKRNLWTLACAFEKFNGKQKFLVTALLRTLSKMFRWAPGGKHTAGTSGTLYLPSVTHEYPIFEAVERRISMLKELLEMRKKLNNDFCISVSSATAIPAPENSVDYIFSDPPFGDNLMYSELSFISESWLRIFTNNHTEAIINKTQQKGLNEYAVLMQAAFREYYRVLKPKRWITVVFHNSKSAVWNAIQEGMTKAGFIIASVTTLDKQQGSFKQVNAAGAVANDLIINAYKPAKQFEESFLQTAGEGMEAAWVEQFLTMQPIQPALERTEKMLYSKMLAYYIQHGYAVRYDARLFYKMLSERFHEDEGYWFTAGQINSWEEYKKRMRLEGMGEVASGAMHLFVSDERSALAWLYQFLDKPENFSDILTAFNQVANIGGDAAPELKVMLEENFVYNNGLYRRPRTEPEREDLSIRRERALLREYERLLLQARTEKGKIKTARRDALLFGFEACYRQKRYDDILALAKKLDRALLDGSTELAEFVEAAEIATGGV
jgi:DNA modification methylase